MTPSIIIVETDSFLCDKENLKGEFLYEKKLLTMGMVAILSVTLLAGCSGDAIETSATAAINTENVETEAVEEIETETTEETEIDEIETETETEAGEIETETEVKEVEPVVEKTVESTPAPTAEPTPSLAPAPELTLVHTHSYTLTSSTIGSNCITAGADTYTCECGDSYTQTNGLYGKHTWTTETTTEKIWHEAVVERGFKCDHGYFFTDEADHHLDECAYRASMREVSPEYTEEITHEHTYCTNCGKEK